MAGVTEMTRAILRCQNLPHCGAVFTIEFPTYLLAMRNLYEKHRAMVAGVMTPFCCPQCRGIAYKVVPIVGELVSTKSCDRKCTDALTGVCRCQCGGANHATGLRSLKDVMAAS